MSPPVTPGRLGPGISLHDHAAALHRLFPDSPLPSYPLPDAHTHRDRRSDHADGTVVLTELLAGVDPTPALTTCLRLHFFLTPPAALTATIQTAPRERARWLGRLLAHRGLDRCGVELGLEILAEIGTVDDIREVRCLAMTGDAFGSAVHRGLARAGTPTDLMWLAERTTDQTRLHLVEELVEAVDVPEVRDWLLRHAMAHDSVMDPYCAGSVAEAVDLHRVLAVPEIDPTVLDNAGLILVAISQAAGRGRTLDHVEHSVASLDHHLRHVRSQGPRVMSASVILQLLLSFTRREPGSTPDPALDSIGVDARIAEYRNLLNDDPWARWLRLAVDDREGWTLWLTHRLNRPPGVDALESLP